MNHNHYDTKWIQIANKFSFYKSALYDATGTSWVFHIRSQSHHSQTKYSHPFTFRLQPHDVPFLNYTGTLVLLALALAHTLAYSHLAAGPQRGYRNSPILVPPPTAGGLAQNSSAPPRITCIHRLYHPMFGHTQNDKTMRNCADRQVAVQ